MESRETNSKDKIGTGHYFSGGTLPLNHTIQRALLNPGLLEIKPYLQEKDFMVWITLIFLWNHVWICYSHHLSGAFINVIGYVLDKNTSWNHGTFCYDSHEKITGLVHPSLKNFNWRRAVIRSQNIWIPQGSKNGQHCREECEFVYVHMLCLRLHASVCFRWIPYLMSGGLCHCHSGLFHISPAYAPRTFYFICLPYSKVWVIDRPTSASLCPFINCPVFRMGKFHAHRKTAFNLNSMKSYCLPECSLWDTIEGLKCIESMCRCF